ncbi:MAG: sulfite reductase subunit alpha [Isosphaeraceae bacterium]
MDIALIPDSAPFTGEQRAWLNGFLAGWIGLNEHQAPKALNGSPVPAATRSEPAPAPEPWHDPVLTINERLQLAEAAPLPRRLMAAMAQLDCGACGYLCRTYGEAIASGSESRLTLCSPGGSDTSKALKRLLKEQAPATNGHSTTPSQIATNGSPPSAAVATNGKAKVTTNGWSRANPFTGRLLRTVNLNGPGSEKETRHVEIELGGDGPSYAVGDSLGVYPENCDALVASVIDVLGARGDELVSLPTGRETALHDALARECCLNMISETLLERLADVASDPGEAAELRRLIDDDSPIAGFDVLDVLLRYPSARPSPDLFVAALSAVAPRLYSISSSPRRHPGQVHLTVRRVAYEFNGRVRKGVASTMLSDRIGPGSALRVFVQKSHGFSLPPNPDERVIMIGPGTGIAPFRAFLHERDAAGAPGKNWLFYGDQRGDHDFLYRDELADLVDRGVLTRLDTAFSRDNEHKVYVQHRLLERGAELFAWLEAGAYLYVCGDAKRMAPDVDRALRAVIREHGRKDEEAARTYLTGLASSGRYRRDVY